MIDEIFDRTYQRGRTDLNAGIDRAFACMGAALSPSLAAFHRLQWSAPWVERRATRKNRAGLA
jgi:hypothetical protein